MRITDLIWALQDIESKHGDLDCVHVDGYIERAACPKVCKSIDNQDRKVVRI